MADPKLLPLALLHIGGESIDGATRFQKLVFLAQEETSLDNVFKYRADKYGPFSPELAQTLDLLEKRELVEKDVKTTRAGHERFEYRLTNRGRDVALTMSGNEEYEPLFEEGQKVKKRHNQKSLDTLLKYVYRKYPDMTEETELDLEELFSDSSSTSRHSRSRHHSRPQ